MSQTAPPPGGPNPGRPQAPAPDPATGRSGYEDSPWATGGAMFAGALLILEGVLGVLNGIVGIAKDDVYANIGDYTFEFNLTTWGWIHLVIGVLLILTGVGIVKGNAAARGVGVGLAMLAVVANFLWLPYQPIWAVVMIGIGIFVIWALLTDRHRAERY
ncbi:hypothetical protein [Streptomyces sp. NPDC060194]|uniref:DUF7144 family membrane protein n=1 Tax=Streptomyces sp. NPDC060194 TaxID=3347069 RepID=UPI00366640A2